MKQAARGGRSRCAAWAVALWGGWCLWIAPAPAPAAPCVGAYEADTFFPTITSNEMDALRTKKILFASRSFGLNMRNGLEDLKNQNPKYDLLSSYVRYDVMNNGLGIIPTNVYSSYNFVHFLATYWPHTKRLEEVETLLRDPPYTFGTQVDVVMVYFHYALLSVFDTYTNVFDTLQADYPNIKFIYVTAGLMDTNHVTENTNSMAFSAKVRTAYKGKVPLYDLGYILNNDGECGAGYCPEYSTDPAGVHPNVDFAEQRMGKAFLLILRDAFFGSACTSSVPPTVPAGLSGAALSDSAIRLSWIPAEHPECGVSRYDLTRDGSFIASTTATNYTDTGRAENTAYGYAVRAVSRADVPSAYSSTATVSTLPDSTPPLVVQARALSSSSVSVEFSENMDPVSAGTATNYALSQGASVLSASPSGKTVVLSTSELLSGTNYTLTINHVADASSAANPLAPNTQVAFTFVRVTYPENPTVWWTFDGTPNDSGSNALHGAWIGASSYAPALLGQGLSLNGATNGSYIRVTHNALLDGMSEMSISVWARKTNAAVGGQLFKKHVVYDLEVQTNSLVGYVYNTNTTPTWANIKSGAITDLNNTNWHHYAVVYNGASVFTYVDGVRRSSNALSGNVSTSSGQPIYIGKDPFSPFTTFAGEMDEMKLFRRALSTNEVSALAAAGFAGSADRAAVRALLDANNLTNKQVDAVSVYQNDRIARLYLQESGVSNLTSHIGQLTALTLLHAYGDRTLGYPLLTQVAPDIGNCVNLSELLLSQNDLASLPAAITNLTALTICSIGDNLLCDAHPVWESWADTYDPDWRDTQICPSVRHIRSTLIGPGSVWPGADVAVASGAGTQLVYAADAWHEIESFTSDGSPVPAAVGRLSYTAVHANVSADISNQVAFAVTTAPADGRTPATWYGPLGADAQQPDQDLDGLLLFEEYLVNTDPTQSNAFRLVSAGSDAQGRFGVGWAGLGLPNGAVEIGLTSNLCGDAWSSPAGTLVYTNGACTWRSSDVAPGATVLLKLQVFEGP
jgi:fibronectin type 3 domain-containing protein